MTRIYEELFIVKPDAPDEEVDAFVETIRTQLTTAGATVDKVDKWGKRRLAYRVDKYREGTYVLFQFSGEPNVVKELERRLRVSDVVLKFLTVRIDETLKRLDKRKTEAEIHLKNATGRLGELQEEAREKYGTDDLAELRKKLSTMKSENDE